MNVCGWFSGLRSRFRSPLRSEVAFTSSARRHGFRLVFSDAYEDRVVMSHEQMVDYILSMSCVMTAIERGHASLQGVTSSVRAESEAFFVRGNGTFVFHDPIWYLRKNAAAKGY